MEEDKYIYTDEGDKIKYADKSPSLIVDKTLLIYGGSNTGKTTIIEEKLFLVKEYIPNYIIIAPSTSQAPYLKKFPKRCIKEDMSKELFIKIWKRQEWTTQLYSISNDIDILRGIFEKIDNQKAKYLITDVCRRAELLSMNLEKNNKLDYGMKKSQISNIEDRKNKEILKIYKSTIRLFKDKISINNLSDLEKIAYQYLDINPRLMIIVDDCTEKLEKWMKMFKKGEDNMFHNVFFRGRHNFISMIIIAHNDKLISTELRNGAMVTIYTDMKSLMLALEKKTNGFSKEEKTLAMRCAKKIFAAPPPGMKNHQKICYIKSDTDYPFQYTIAEIYPDFVIGCKALYSLAEKMKDKLDTLDTNPFVKNLLKPKNDYDD
jgi:hypothetical protein